MLLFFSEKNAHKNAVWCLVENDKKKSKTDPSAALGRLAYVKTEDQNETTSIWLSALIDNFSKKVALLCVIQLWQDHQEVIDIFSKK